MSSWILQTIKSPEIISVVLTLLAGAIGRFLAPTAKVVWGISHGFTFLVPNQGSQANSPIPVNIGSVFVQNLGRKTAEDIEVILNYRPQHFEVWPVLNFETVQTPDGHFIIKIRNLGHREFATIELFSAHDALPLTLRVRSPRGEARRVKFAPMRVMPRWFNRLAMLLLVLGLFTATYALVRLIGFLSGL